MTEPPSTCYIAGAVTGVPDAQERFDRATAILLAEGWDAYNPMAHPRSYDCLIESELMGDRYADGPIYRSLMRDFAAEIVARDAVFALPRWRHSRGATFEVFLATMVGKPVFKFAPDGDHRVLRASFSLECLRA